MRHSIFHSRFRNTTCLVLATLLFGSSILEARGGVSGPARPGRTELQQKPTLKQRILEIPPGTMIEVRLLNKQKIRGRLGEIDDEGFSIKTVQGNTIGSQKLAFTEVKSVKQVEGGRKFGKGVVYALAGIGVLTVLLIVWGLAAAS